MAKKKSEPEVEPPRMVDRPAEVEPFEPNPFSRFDDNVLLQTVTSDDTLSLPPVEELAPVTIEAPVAVAEAPDPNAYPNYSAAALVHGTAVPLVVRKDADPLLVENLMLMERILAGGLLNYAAYSAYAELLDQVRKTRERVCES